MVSYSAGGSPDLRRVEAGPPTGKPPGIRNLDLCLVGVSSPGSVGELKGIVGVWTGLGVWMGSDWWAGESLLAGNSGPETGPTFRGWSGLEMDLLSGEATGLLILGSTLMTRVVFPARRIPSNSTSRYVGLAGTDPRVYGFPLRVAAGFHCFDLEEEKRDGNFFLLFPDAASCCRYSRGTNSSYRISVVDMRGSPLPETVLDREMGRDLYST